MLGLHVGGLVAPGIDGWQKIAAMRNESHVVRRWKRTSKRFAMPSWSLSALLPRASDALPAFALQRRLSRLDRMRRAEILELQQLRLRSILDFAAERSPFYRRRWRGRAPVPNEFRDIEPVCKQELFIEGLDDALTEGSVRREHLGRWIGVPDAPYVVLSTSGTTGEPAIVPYSRAEWVRGLAHMLRAQTRFASGVFRLLRTWSRFAQLTTENPVHLTTRLGQSFDVFPIRRLSIAASAPLPEQIQKLERFQPVTLAGYPSAIDSLAKTAVEGRLRIRPRVILTGGESSSLAFRDRVRHAWNSEVFDCYGLTETLVIAFECPLHEGLHIDEDAAVLEVVDDQDRPVPHGDTGKAVLITNLYFRTLPVIRYRVDDVLAVTEEPCRCGLPWARILKIDGRRGEFLTLRTRDGSSATIHISAIEAALDATPGLRRFQVKHENGKVRIIVLARRENEAQEVGRRARDAVLAALQPHRLGPNAVDVEVPTTLSELRGLTDKRTRFT